MSTETSTETDGQDTPVDDDERAIITVVWLPTRRWMSFTASFLLFLLAVQFFRDYVLNPNVETTTFSGMVMVVVLLVVILRLMIGATSQRKTVLDIDNKTLHVVTRRLGVTGKHTYRPQDFSDVKIRRRKPPSNMDRQLAKSSLLTLSLYSFDHEREIKCAQGFSENEMRELAEFIADEFNLRFSGEIEETKAINPFWPD